MTPQEAISALKQINLKGVHPFYDWEEMREVRDTAINALEKQIACEKCPILNHCDCSVKMARNALDLINRQKAEIERLKRLLAEADITYNKCAKRFYKEGVEDFAKRLKDRPRKHLLLRPDSYYKQYVRVTDIDSLKKEMVGAE